MRSIIHAAVPRCCGVGRRGMTLCTTSNSSRLMAAASGRGAVRSTQLVGPLLVGIAERPCPRLHPPVRLFLLGRRQQGVGDGPGQVRAEGVHAASVVVVFQDGVHHPADGAASGQGGGKQFLGGEAAPGVAGPVDVAGDDGGDPGLVNQRQRIDQRADGGIVQQFLLRCSPGGLSWLRPAVPAGRR